jgi:predicted  nucleic acid-binding Zn-ribbon protein
MIREHTTWTAHCAGCHIEYGDTFDNKAYAQDFIEEYPLCSTCAPEEAS